MALLRGQFLELPSLTRTSSAVNYVHRMALSIYRTREALARTCPAKTPKPQMRHSESGASRVLYLCPYATAQPHNPARLHLHNLGRRNAEDHRLFFDGHLRLALGPLAISRPRINLHHPDPQASYYPQITSRPQRSPILRSSLPAISDTMEGIRKLESTVWQVKPNFRA